MQPVGTGGEVVAEDAPQRGVTVGIAADHAAHHRWEAEGAGDAVDGAVVQRQVVGQRVGERRLGVGERQPREQACPGDPTAQTDIVEAVEQERQRREDLGRGQCGVVGRDRVGVDVPDALQRVREGVETGRQSQTPRHLERRPRIEDRVFRIKVGTVERVLLLGLGVPHGRP